MFPIRVSNYIQILNCIKYEKSMKKHLAVWSISSGIEVYDTSLAVEWTRQALKMLINLSTWSKLQTL